VEHRDDLGIAARREVPQRLGGRLGQMEEQLLHDVCESS
jgi:hypothetical protein